MNILFTVPKISVGGVAVVSIELANKFLEFGHKVSFFAFIEEYDPISYQKIFPDIQIYFGKGMNNKRENVKLLSDIFNREKIDIVINQWGLHYFNITCIRKAIKYLPIKVITVYHNDPLSNSRLKDVEMKLLQTSNQLKRYSFHIQWHLYKFITSQSMRYVYNHSDRYLVLSPSYVKHFKLFTGIKKPTKLLVQTNPITIDASDFNFNLVHKEDEIIYVGRIDKNQKRVCRVIDTWHLLEDKFPNWRLTIVGDGPEKKNIETQVKEFGLQRVCFEGFKPSKEYYRRASVLILTSDFEGFPLVLAECMSFGVIPVVYGSFSAVYDIIEDGKDGIIVSKKNGFDAGFMAEKIKELLDDKERLNQMALNAVEKSKAFSINRICEQWERLFSELRVN